MAIWPGQAPYMGKQACEINSQEVDDYYGLGHITDPNLLETTMAIPLVNYNPPFNITHASHVILNASDLAASKATMLTCLA